MKTKTIGYVINFKPTKTFVSGVHADGYLATGDQTIMVFPDRKITQKAIKKDIELVNSTDCTKNIYEIRRAVSYVDVS